MTRAPQKLILSEALMVDSHMHAAVPKCQLIVEIILHLQEIDMTI